MDRDFLLGHRTMTTSLGETRTGAGSSLYGRRDETKGAEVV